MAEDVQDVPVKPGGSAPPFSYAVLVPAGDRGLSAWKVIYSNGDLASARAKAEEWAEKNQGVHAVVVQYVDHVQIVTMPKWAKA